MTSYNGFTYSYSYRLITITPTFKPIEAITCKPVYRRLLGTYTTQPVLLSSVLSRRHIESYMIL